MEELIMLLTDVKSRTLEMLAMELDRSMSINNNGILVKAAVLTIMGSQKRRLLQVNL